MLWSPETAGFAPPIILFLALLLDAVFGEFGPLFRVLPHPVALIGSLIGWFDRRLNRDNRSSATRLIRGVVVTILMVGFAAGIGWALLELGRRVPNGWIIEVLAVTLLWSF